MEEDNLKQIADYLKGINIKDNWIIMTLNFSSTWSVNGNKEGTIKVSPSKNADEWFIVGKKDSVNIYDMIKFAKDTILFNIELDKKKVLFSQLEITLEELFEQNSLDKLKTLCFTFGKDEHNNNIKQPKKKLSKAKPVGNDKMSYPESPKIEIKEEEQKEIKVK